MPKYITPPPEIDIGICQRLKKTRQEAGLTQQEFADQLGVRLSHYKRIEIGHYSPNLEFLKSWKSKFKKSYNYILDGL